MLVNKEVVNKGNTEQSNLSSREYLRLNSICSVVLVSDLEMLKIPPPAIVGGGNSL